MNMAGHLNNDIISDFENSFRTNCLTLIGEAYKWLKETKSITVDWNEETISANIFTHIDESEKAITWNINVSDECRLYHQAILNNKKSAKSASRIDLKLSTNWIEATKRVSYFVEAKNLIENNCVKQGRKTKLNANKIQERYISTGIDQLISGEYPSNGCMLGYVLEGTTSGVVKSLNAILSNLTRNNEELSKIELKIPYIEETYTSIHANNYTLNHYFLQFSNSQNS